MIARMLRVSVSAGFLLVWTGCGWPTPEPPESASAHPGNEPPAPVFEMSESSGGTPVDGHQRMLMLLRQLRDRGTYEQWKASALQEQLARLPANVPEADRLELHREAGVHLLRLGETETALHHLQAAYQLLPQVPLPDAEHERIILELAIGYLRAAENENCVECHNSESCLLPIQGEGIHEHQANARQAIDYLEILLERNPAQLTARWLLNVASMAVGDYPMEVHAELLIPPEEFMSDKDFPRFLNVAAELGLNTVNLSGGVIIDDFDNSGFLDIVSSTWGTGGQIRYFRNNGNGTFTERTEEAGLKGLFGGLNLVQADYNNDGFVDILVLRGAWRGEEGRHPNSLLENDGQGGFRDVTFEAGLGEIHLPTQTAAWADYNNNGYLDLYIGNEEFPAQLFQNNGNGTFTDMAQRAGVENHGFTKGVVWGDYNETGYPDLYVSNLTGPNRLYQNNGDGTFTDVAPQAGVDRPIHSFATWFWDFNNDGVLDLFVGAYGARMDSFVADYLGLPHDAETDRLFQGDGNGGFVDVSRELNVDRLTLPMGANFGDLDHDGYPDFYLGTGDPAFETLTPARMYYNLRGQGFADVTTAGGFGHLQKGHGIAFADLDHSGNQDVFMQTGGAYPGDFFADTLFKNPGFDNHWIAVKLVGTSSNRSAIGTRIRAEIEESGMRRSVYKWVNSGGSFGANPLRQQIGLGQATNIKTLEIFWPASGETQRFHDVAVDQFIGVTEGKSSYRKLPW